MNRRQLNILIVSGISLLAALLAPTRWGSRLEGVAADALAPLTRAGETMRAGLLGVLPAPGSRRGGENDAELDAARRELQTHVARLRELQEENDRLRSLLDFRQQIPFVLKAAFVLGETDWHNRQPRVQYLQTGHVVGVDVKLVVVVVVVVNGRCLWLR